MRKSLGRALLASALIALLIPTPAQAATVNYNCGTSGTFQVDNVTNTVTGNTNCVGDLTIPEGVVAIATSAFTGKTGLGAVSIPASMRTINTYAFNGTNFTSFTFAEGTTTINAYAFANSTSQVPISFPNSVTTLGDRIFDQARMSTLSFGPNINQIGTNAFYNNYGYGPTYVEFRGGAPLVTTIPTGALIGYRGGEITLPVNITSIGARAMDTLPNLRYLIVPDSVTSIGAQAFSPGAALKTVVLPNALTTLGATAFGTGLQTVVYCGATSAVQTYAYPNSVVPTCGKAAIFEANGGTGTMAAQVRTTSGALTTNGFSRVGYAFNGWNTKADGTGVSYGNTANYNFSNHIVLYAQWVVPDVTAPTFLTNTSQSKSENQTAVTSIVVSESATISINSGSDQGNFSLSRVADSATSLAFISAPDFESPTDGDANNTYIVALRAIDSSGNIGYETFTVTITDAAEQITIVASTIPNTVQKGVSSNLSLTFDSPVTATFRFNGKKIPSCIAKASATSSPFTVTCPFKPNIHGAGSLTVAFTELSGINYGGTASLGSMSITKRSNRR